MSVFSRATSSRSRSLTSVISGITLLTASALVLSGCSASGDTNKGDDGAKKPVNSKELTLKIGSLLPETGNLAYLGPPEETGVQLAVKEVNDAKAGITLDLTLADSGDPDNKAYATTVPNLINKGVSAIIGAAASGVSKLVIDQITGAGIIQLSPANTSPDFTDWDDDGLYWRTAPSDNLQGEVLGNKIAADGAQTLGIIAMNDPYGTGLQKQTQKTFEEAGGKVVKTEYFNVGDTNFAAQISSVLAQKPDAIELISFDESLTIIPALKDAGFDTSKLYLVDGNLKQFDTKLPAGVMTGAQGTTPGPVLSDDFQKRLVDLYAANNDGKKLTDFSYAGESYDAVILIALAALAAQSTDGKAIAAKLQEVSGGGDNPGKKATSFKDAAAIINAGDVVDYDGYSGGVKFDKNGDPTEASIGIYKYDETNHFTRIN